MKIIQVPNKIYEDIKSQMQTQIILEEDINVKDIIVLQNGEQKINAEITAKAKYNSIEDCFKLIPIDLFGVRTIDEAKQIYGNIKKINVYRLKVDTDEIETIYDDKLLSLIDRKSLKKNNVGHSSTNVYEVNLTNGKEAILKVQHLTNRNDLYEEYKRIIWLQGKCNVPEVYYYAENGKDKFMLMEKKEGISAHKYEGFAKLIGKELKKIHSINIENCNFSQNNVETLLKNAINNIDVIYHQINEIYPEMSKSEVIDFLKNNVPTDKVLVHGDYSLPNILINKNGEIGLIDLGDVSISSMYFDFFYLRKSMIRNKKIEQFEELLHAYGIKELDEKYMKWIEFVDKALF